jgi:hypothetical protein
MQLAPGWRTGTNCDQYPRGDRRLGEAGTNLRPAYNRGARLSVRMATQPSFAWRLMSVWRAPVSRIHQISAVGAGRERPCCVQSAPQFLWNSSADAGVKPLCRLRTAFLGGLTTGESAMAYDRIASLTVEEMSALANRFEARAQSVLLRDQPQMQSDMRLAARLIYELAGGTPATQDQLRLRIGQDVE